MRRGWDTIRNHHVSKRKIVSVQDLLRTSIDVWQKELPEVDTDELLADGSINKLIYTRLQEVFGAFLDAAAVAGSWIVVDRTCGQGSATAELLIEQALERGAQRPIILAIDSLERLGKARDGSRSHGIIKQLNRMFVDDEAASQNPNGTEKVLDINFAYSLHDFDAASEYNVAESRLPFDVADDHKADAQGGVACDPMRKWSYFYSDALFASASYYVLKNDDRDEFDIESFAKLGFVYANGDTCTYRRLRRDVQQGKPMVLLHNSGGVVTAFSWLQRVMAFARPVPSLDELRGPLKFLVANLSRDAWIEQLGTPEMSIMKGLADRAPQLFMKRIVSVDILTDSEESTLELMTACFASASAVSELGLGHADVNVIFNAWNLHLTLCENAVRFRAKFVKAQLLLWALAVMTACVAISAASLGDAGDTDGALLQRALMLNASSTAEITTWMDRTVVLLPIFSALVGAIAAKQSWQDKWSVSVMAATYLAFEIYKFRTSTFEYDPSRPTPSVLGRHKVALKTKDTAQNARQVFVSRVQEFYGACVNEIARGGALQRKQAKVSAASVQDLRAAQESRPTFAEWYKLKLHVEDHSYRTAWTLPRGNLAKWSSGLTPYLQQPTLREDLRTVVENLVGTNRVTLKGVALSDADSKRVRQGLAATLGLAKNALEVHADEIRELQREVAKVLGKQQASQDDEAPDTVEGTQAGPGNANLRATSKAGKTRVASAPLSAREGDHPLGNSAADGKVVADAAMAMRKVIADLQGLPFGPITAAERREAKVNNTKQTAEGKGGEDDYLLDPLSIDNYVMFRLRPVVDRWEHEVWMLSRRLHAIDAMSFVISTIGVVLATGVVNALEWVPITVLLVVLLTAAAEFTQLRNREAACFEPTDVTFLCAPTLPDPRYLASPAFPVWLRGCTNEFFPGRLAEDRRQMGIIVSIAAPFKRSQGALGWCDRAGNTRGCEQGHHRCLKHTNKHRADSREQQRCRLTSGGQ
jgi:hypothetical protein